MTSAAGRTVASFPSYEQAQYAVDALSDRRFPVEQLTIVGSNLRSVEQVTGRRDYLRAAVDGALSGAIVGALIGWLLGLFSLIEPLISAVLLALWGVVIGGVLGALIGLIGHALTRGRRDFSSVSSVQADRYDIIASPTVAEDAERELAEIIRSAPELQRTT